MSLVRMIVRMFVTALLSRHTFVRRSRRRR